MFTLNMLKAFYRRALSIDILVNILLFTIKLQFIPASLFFIFLFFFFFCKLRHGIFCIFLYFFFFFFFYKMHCFEWRRRE